jgi:hypothetical protein
MELIKQLNVTVDIGSVPPNCKTINVALQFPLQDGSFLVRNIEPHLLQFGVKYAKDRLICGHNADFMHDEKFDEATRLANEQNRRIAAHNMFDAKSWNYYVCCWAACHTLNLPGDFVECGVNTGILSRTVMHYTDFNSTGKTFYLCDTFTGIPEEQVTQREKTFFNRVGADGVRHHNTEYYTRDIYEDMLREMKGFNVKLIRGKVPETLSQVDTDKVCFLSIDMNIEAPEIAAADYFWDKMVKGGMIIIDDYGWDWHLPQKEAFDEFAKKMCVKILPLPTGQGLIIKP